MHSTTSHLLKSFRNAGLLVVLTVAGSVMPWATNDVFGAEATVEFVRKATYIYATCNSDGWIHIHFLFPDGSTNEYSSDVPCGPIMHMGPSDVFEFVLSDRTRMSPKGKEFLAAFEKRLREGSPTPRRVGVGSGTAARGPAGLIETIYLRPADVGPGLDALLTRISKDWKRDSSPKSAKPPR